VDAEGRVVVVASAGELLARAKIVVRFPDISDLIAASLEEGLEDPDAGHAAPMPEARPGAVQGVGRAGVSPAGEPRELLWALLAVAGAAALLLLCAVVFILRRRRAREDDDGDLGDSRVSHRPSKGPKSAPPRERLLCPTCGREFEEGRSFCPDDASELVRSGSTESAAGAEENLICPRCRRGFDGAARFCPHDSEKLVPYAVWRESRMKEREKKSKQRMICPQCATRYEPGTLFCEKDGAKLEPVN